MKIETQEDFDEFIGVKIPEQLFHVMPTDLDDIHKVKLDELILIQMLNESPGALKFKPLNWFVQHFIESFSLK